MEISTTPEAKPTIAELRREFTEAHQEEFLTRPVVAAGIAYSLSWLEVAATRGGGPPYYKRGRRVLYKKAEVLTKHLRKLAKSDPGGTAHLIRSWLQEK